VKSAQETLRVYVKRAECLDIPLREQRVEMKCALEGIHFENLALAVSSAMRTRDMRGNAAFAFRACLELRCAPAVSSATHLLLHFGCSALGYCHGISRLRLFEWLIESLFLDTWELGWIQRRLIFECIQSIPRVWFFVSGGRLYLISRGLVHC